ncbi:MAG TPA: peptide chain release factor N(5)-glutamine methyltransferase [Gaiellaceae bacterium]|jgi:release factor glutamine methyltransferase|nr:peptide chain release factor N(5)-glutamine methyltransferase [Gaiellaceae bacterium]
MTSRELLSSAAEDLSRAGCPSPKVDAEWLMAHVLGATRTELYANGSRTPTREEEQRFRELVERRARREPLAYLLGEWGFRRLSLRVDTRVLIPRPETEAVVERCLELLADVAEPRVLDVGVGSGAIALSIADEHPGARVVATESSEGALAVADENRARTGLADRVELVQGELFAGLEGPFDLVVSNPPYVDPAEVDRLQPEVARYEPRQALVASGVTEAIAEGALTRLRPGGTLVLETADGKAGEVAALLTRLEYGEVSIVEDLAGRERVVDGRAPH